MRGMILIGVLFLAACAEVAGNDVSGTVANSMSASEAFRMAEAHCTKFGKKARVTQSNPYQGSMTFDCV